MFNNISRCFTSDYVFTNKDGKPYLDIKRSFKTACRKARIEDFKFHDLRHTFASHLVMSGVNLTCIKDLLGHSDIKMTMRYAHLTSDHKKTSLNNFAEMMDV